MGELMIAARVAIAVPCAKPLYWRSLGGPVWVLGGGLLAARECVAMGRARACIASAELSMR